MHFGILVFLYSSKNSFVDPSSTLILTPGYILSPCPILHEMLLLRNQCFLTIWVIVWLRLLLSMWPKPHHFTPLLTFLSFKTDSQICPLKIFMWKMSMAPFLGCFKDGINKGMLP